MRNKGYRNIGLSTLQNGMLLAYAGSEKFRNTIVHRNTELIFLSIFLKPKDPINSLKNGGMVLSSIKSA